MPISGRILRPTWRTLTDRQRKVNCMSHPGTRRAEPPRQRRRGLMPTSVKEMLAAANAAVPRIGREEAAALMAGGDVLVVDVRDAPEILASGKVEGAMHVSRGVLEFRADPEFALPRPRLRPRPDRDRLLRLRRAVGAGRQGPEGPWLSRRAQPRRLQGLGRERRPRRAGLTRFKLRAQPCPPIAPAPPPMAATWPARAASGAPPA